MEPTIETPMANAIRAMQRLKDNHAAALAERDAEIANADALLYQIQQWVRDGFTIAKRADAECSPTVSREHGISFLDVFPSTEITRLRAVADAAREGVERWSLGGYVKIRAALDALDAKETT